ncbi:MAG: QueT transporter family protein [Clostridia bacterium]|nr:QueT transporter family protein [Clostridia bacterium]
MKPYFRTRYLSEAAMIAALYLLLTLLTFSFSSGAVQLRLSEALAVLPYFTPAAIPGLTVGCLLSNLISGCAPWDVVFGSLATLIGAILAWFFRRLVYLVPIPNIVSNTVIIPLVLRFACGSEEVLPFLFLSIGVSELLSSGVLGLALLLLLRRYGSRIFKKY